MFLDYRKVVKPKPLKTITQNPEVVDYFTKLAPKGTKYIPTADNSLVLVGIKNTTFGGLAPQLTEEQQSILGKNPSFEEIITYMDNAQEPIHLCPIKPGYVTINNNEIPIEHLQLTPFDNIKYKNGRFMLLPHTFQPFEIILSANGIIKTVCMKQVPIKSITKHIFETVPNSIFELKYITDTKSMDFELSFSYNLDKEQSAKNIYETYNLIYGLFSGNAKLGHFNLKALKCEAGEREHYKALVDAWKKIAVLENKLNIVLVPQNTNAVRIDTDIVEMLYQSIIYKQPIKRGFEINNVTVIKNHNDLARLNNFKGGTHFFSFNDTETFTLFGIQLAIYRIVFATNMRVIDIVEEDATYKIIFKRNDDSFCGALYFATEKDRSDYISTIDVNGIINDSKSLSELLKGA